MPDHSPAETGHLSAASAQNGYSRLEMTELSGVLAFDHERDKKPTPVSVTLLLTHHDVLGAGGMSLSPPHSGVDSLPFCTTAHRGVSVKGRRHLQHPYQS